MTEVIGNGRACATNPLKLSPAFGGSLAFLGIDRCLPLLHGSQGCTAFALVLMVRHFREAIPLQTTAMSELSTILGGADNVETAIGNIYARAKPRVIGICSTALTDTRGEDIEGELRQTLAGHEEWVDLDVVLAPTPDYAGGLQEGWAAAVEAVIADLVPEGPGKRTLRQVNLLPGSHLTPADVEELRELILSFGLAAVVLPDLSGSLDGHVPDEHVPTSHGGTTVDAIRSMGQSRRTIAIGEQMRGAAEALERKTGVPACVFPSLAGLEATDTFVAALMEIAGGDVPERLKRQRSRLVDTMLDAHFYFSGRSIAIAAEPDLLLSISTLVSGMGASIGCAVTTVTSPAASRVPAARVIVGDLDDLERGAGGCDLIIASAHGRQAAERLDIPLYRVGFPIFDRLGAAQRRSVGYRGAAALLCEIGNILMDAGHGHERKAGHDRVMPHGGGAFDAQVASH
ncbi:MAG TPA: nitrogenase iron-molybdenum cofactor biosynthesis protein NifN [Rhodospirillales bacterium]|nr:nitrogenase iron-molybdenum cofactor biosynthesis protein NifN [Rhodospirillales bacterium]